jgi:hypothetical protein
MCLLGICVHAYAYMNAVDGVAGGSSSGGSEGSKEGWRMGRLAKQAVICSSCCGFGLGFVTHHMQRAISFDGCSLARTNLHCRHVPLHQTVHFEPRCGTRRQRTA